MLVTASNLMLFRTFDNTTNYSYLSKDRTNKYLLTKEQYDAIAKGTVQISLELSEKIGDTYSLVDTTTGAVTTGARKYNKFTMGDKISSIADQRFAVEFAKLRAEAVALGL